MLPLPRFELFQPRSLDEAVALLAEHPDARVLAGGTDLVPNLKHGLLAPRALVSLARVESLKGVRVEGERLVVGAMTSLQDVADSLPVREDARALAEAAASVGGPPHRRMGTLGGNVCLDTRCRYVNQTYFWREALGFCLKKDGTVCHVVSGGRNCVAAASNDTAPALLALDAAVVLVSSRGRRELALRDFYTSDGVRNVDLAPDEVLVEVRVPRVPGRASAHEKLRRRAAIDFPLLSVGASLDLEGGAVRRVEVVVSALAAKPRRLVAAAKVAPGTPPSGALASALSEAAYRECKPLENIEGDALWRREMVPVVVARALARVGLSG